VHEQIKVVLALWWQVLAARLARCPPDRSTAVVPPAKPRSKPSAQVCDYSLSTFDARVSFVAGRQLGQEQLQDLLHEENAAVKSPTPVRGDWSLALDQGRLDRAAWIATEDGSALDFPLAFGPNPHVTLVHTLGYDGSFGDIEVSLAPLSASWVAGGGLSTSPTNSASPRLRCLAPAPVRILGCCDHNNFTQSQLSILDLSSTQYTGAAAHNADCTAFGIDPNTNATLRLTFIKGTSEKHAVRLLSSC
jgi:hypothetical protein